MSSTMLTMDDLDQFQYRSGIRDVARDDLDGKLSDERRINSVIAHYATLLLDQHIATEVTITTPRYNESVQIRTPSQRSPVWSKSFVVEFREDMWSTPDGRRAYTNQFRDTVARYIFEVARTAIQVAEDYISETEYAAVM